MQKWMKLYTKVLGKLVSDPDLSLKVTFEVPAEHEQAESKAAETRTGSKSWGSTMMFSSVEACSIHLR